MKRCAALLSLLLCLSGCAAQAAEAPEPAPAPPPVVVMSAPDVREEAPADDVQQTQETEMEEESSAEQTGEDAISDEPKPQAGDTTQSWNPALAEAWASDGACGDAELLEKWLAVEGLTQCDLDARACRQLILVSAQPTDGVESLTVCYERETGGSFAAVEGLPRMHGHVGKNGILHDRRRNSNTSPAGLWALGTAFGNAEQPEGLKLPWRQVTPNSDWVCDEDSPYFNTWQERDEPGLLPWSDDVEHLEDYPELYAYACVIEFNRPPEVDPERGCAIFLHCSERGTGGCVGLPREDLLAVLRWLDPAKNPYILITGVQRDAAPNDA